MAKFKPLPPLEELRARFDYDPDTGLFTHHGKPRGYLTKQGYVMLRWGRARQLRANRVAWYLATGVDPFDKLVEHENGNRADNSLKNLRLATNQENDFNRKDAIGCYERNGKFRAKIRVDGRLISLGTFLTFEEAQAAYREKAVELRGEFAPQAWRQGSA